MGPAVAVLAGPLLAFALLAVMTPLRRSGRPAAWLSILGVALSLTASLALLAGYLEHPEPRSSELLWAPLERFPAVKLGLLVDGLSVAMLPLVALVALLVQVYSLGYMSAESRGSLGRYYAFHSLFAFSMLGFVLAHNTLQAYAFWELVGLCSYLLIGFWYRRPEAARAAVKAFWTTRLGDVGFAVGVVLLWGAGGSFVFEDLFREAASGRLAGPLLVAGVLGLFVGAMGKSAQFPLHVWLPDAMEGPTPVSALIHAATMVAAGVFLMIRIAPLLALTPQVAAWVVGLGALTAFMAASMAVVERDLKRILAYSTVSQLGYMMTAVGAGAAAASFFHLLTHGFFKALLFLAAGSVIHALGTNDIFRMGRLFRPMPLTGAFFLVGGLALAGVWPTSGFFSKDEILSAVWAGGHPVAFFALVATASLTAFYVFRAFFSVFLGPREAEGRPHESPAVMTAPMAVLAMLALAAWLFMEPVESLLESSISIGRDVRDGLHGSGLVPVFAGAAGLLGIAVAWLGYQAGRFSPAAVGEGLGPVTRLLERRYFLDDLFVALYRALYLGLTALLGWVDRYLVDGVVNFLTWLTYALAGAMRRVHNGRVQDALYAVVLGLLLLVILL